MASDAVENIYANYNDAHDSKYGNPHKVPIVRATRETLYGYGTLVFDYDKEKIEMTPWPVTGTRPLCKGTGMLQPETDGNYGFEWVGDKCKAVNTAIGWGADEDFVTARLAKGVDPEKRTACLVREATYHPDGGQVFYPMDGKPFIALLALPGDNIKMEDFRAFYCDGSFGIHIKAGVWHQPMYPVEQKQWFRNKQGSVHACITVDTVSEFGKFLFVPLKLE